MARALLCALVWLTAAAPVRSQELQPPSPLVRVWQTEQGLPQNTVTAVTRTRDGYCWIGTLHGLARFDGLRFVVFNSSNTPAFKSDRISALAQDTTGNLWIGTQGGGVVRLRGGGGDAAAAGAGAGAFTHFSVAQGLASDMTTCLTAGANGAVWVGTVYGLSCFHGERFTTFRTRDGLPGTEILALATDGAGGIWIGTNLGPAHWEKGMLTPHHWLMPVDGLADAGNGEMWVSGKSFGLLRGQISSVRKMRQMLPLGRVTALSACPGGAAWAAMEDGALWRFESGGKTAVGAALPPGGIRSLYQDDERNVWAGLNGGGLARLKERQLIPVPAPGGGTGTDAVIALAGDREGRLWAGGASGELMLFQKDRFHAVDAGPGFGAKGPILTLCAGSGGSLWIGKRGGGLYRWDQGNVSVPDAGGKSIAAVVTALFEDQSGQLWIGTEAEGILNYHGGKFTRFTRRDGFSRDQANCIAQQPDGTLWFGTADGGINCLRNGGVRTFRTADGLGSDSVRALLVDRAGLLWVGTTDGLSLYRNGRFFSFTARQGLTHGMVSQIGGDNAGHFWLGSNRGLLRVPRGELLEVAEGVRARVTAVPFGSGDGMPSPECPGGRQNATLMDPAGRLWFTTIRGLVAMDRPAPETTPPPAPSAMVEQVALDDGTALADPLIFGQGVTFPGGLTVPPGLRRLEFQFTAPSLRSPEKILFRHRMKGLDADWTYSGTGRNAMYFRLPFGTYEFQVEASGEEGRWAGSPGVAVVVRPHYWETTLFKAGIGVAVVLAAAGLLGLRSQRRRELEQVRLRIAGDLHDELGSNLAGIVLLSRRVGRQSAISERERGELGEISRIAVQTTQAARDIVWFINPSCDTPREMILRMRETAAILLTDIPYDFQAPEATDQESLPPEFRRHLFLAFKELLHNVVRHSGATRVEIAVHSINRVFSISVRDNGVGFDPETIQHSGGLKNAQLRLKRLHGELHVRSRPGGGSLIEFSAPLS
ncbi:MAG: Two component regulator, sensor protein [Verrucomicrobiales bacterium]|nr:Two component regulator, sensor protein [Verrucomicrobiales bacterium]